MRHQDHSNTTVETPVADRHSYEAYQAHVELAYERMQVISATPHAPCAARQAAAELAAALRDASTTAAELAGQAQGRAVRPAGHGRHRRADRDAARAAARLSRELLRFSEIAIWLRWTTLDDLGVLLPTTVRVGNYAANGPHLPGLDFGTGEPAELHEPLIGVDLPAIIDRYRQDPATTAPVVLPLSAPAQAA